MKNLLFFWKSLWGLYVESYRRDRFKAKKCGRVGLCMFDHESGESWVKVRIPHCIKLARVLLHVGQTHHSNNRNVQVFDIDIYFLHIYFTREFEVYQPIILAHCQAKLYNAIATVSRLKCWQACAIALNFTSYQKSDVFLRFSTTLNWW